MTDTLTFLQKQFTFVLLSQSPRRKQLLTDAGLSFTIRPADVDETIRDRHVKKDILVVTKNKVDAHALLPRTIGIACDTVVVFGGKVYGKPKNKDEARMFLRTLSNRKHQVISGLVVKVVGKKQIKYYQTIETTDVFFRKLSSVEIEEYIATKEPYDKAGAYGMQDLRRQFVKRVNGCYYNVVGLPMAALRGIFESIKGDYEHEFF
jgi:septum formation protein